MEKIVQVEIIMQIERSQLRQWNKNTQDKNWIDLLPEVQTMKVKRNKQLGRREFIFNEYEASTYNKLSE